MITLGIETSCDDTALAIIETRDNKGTFECRVISSLVHSQADLHSAYGGVFPSLAKREHGKNLVPLFHKLLIDSKDYLNEVAAQKNSQEDKVHEDKFTKILESFRNNIQGSNPDLYESVIGANFLKNIPAIDRIAVTEGPGLEPALWVGISFARFLGELWEVPIIPVNHMEGHILGSLLESDITNGVWHKLKPLQFPALALLISGGHTELVEISKDNQTNKLKLQYKIIGQTKDDAVGEAFDKVARLLGLPYPGGPHISKLAHEAWEQKIVSPVKLPRPMMTSGDLNFSFSGLKTAVLYAVRKNSDEKGQTTDEFRKGLSYEFEQAIKESLEKKVRMATDQIGAQTLIIGGGVSANHVLRNSFIKIAEEYGIPIYLPTRHISGDNALMIALAGSLADSHSGTLKADGTKKLGK